MRFYRRQGGWLLLELLLAWVIGAWVMVAAWQYFSASYAQILQVMQVCHRATTLQKWLIWVKDAFDQSLSNQHCDKQGSGQGQSRVQVSTLHSGGMVLHSCRWLDQRWQWVDTEYYVRKKRGVNYLYEKTVGQPAVAWIADIDKIQLRSLPLSGLKPSYHVSQIKLVETNVWQRIGLQPILKVVWHDKAT